ncbi:ubiquitin ligase subunit [Anopheles sinensis]|uniref:Ubiquitin ligase subunit n=1 Tax=Anopheles sinensis TaxID=74873 RepID=A0A084VXD8_ANOSI|nr:ubiquitin ligase subunit [Anopheles sinensis]
MATSIVSCLPPPYLIRYSSFARERCLTDPSSSSSSSPDEPEPTGWRRGCTALATYLTLGYPRIDVMVLKDRVVPLSAKLNDIRA